MTEDHELKMLRILLVYTSEIVWSWCGRCIHMEFDSTDIVIKAEEMRFVLISCCCLWILICSCNHLTLAIISFVRAGGKMWITHQILIKKAEMKTAQLQWRQEAPGSPSASSLLEGRAESFQFSLAPAPWRTTPFLAPHRQQKHTWFGTQTSKRITGLQRRQISDYSWDFFFSLLPSCLHRL